MNLENFIVIDMRGLHKHPYYPYILSEFKESFSNDCTHNSWSKFKKLHLSITHNRCPICECKLDGSVTRETNNGLMEMNATIDHFRPKDITLYPLLKCDDKNYLVMCKDCNEAYKGNKFPLFGDQIRDITSNSTTNITTEQPLIINPIYDDLLELFILVFTSSLSGKKVLELKPKYEDGYLYEKAKETIKLFSLGNCEVDVHENDNIQNCRINLLHHHYSKFHECAKAFKLGQIKKALSIQKRYNLKNYGFYIFIQKKQFKL